MSAKPLACSIIVMSMSLLSVFRRLLTVLLRLASLLLTVLFVFFAGMLRLFRRVGLHGIRPIRLLEGICKFLIPRQGGFR